MQQHGSKYFAVDQPPPDPGERSKGQNLTFFRTYQIKGN